MSVFVIAECGVNHNGFLSEALEMVVRAKDAGADAAKFQLFKSHKLWGDERIKHLELSFDAMTMLHKHCAEVGIEFMCTPFGVEEAMFLRTILKRYKIASGCINRMPLLEYIGESGLPVIMSTGMSTLQEARLAVSILTRRRESWNITLLHCTSSYPCDPADVNLNAMARLGWPVGLSDHTTSTVIPAAAVAMGATVIEKHFTLDRSQPGPDHAASLEPAEFRQMVENIREVEASMGDGVKRPRECEMELRKAWGRD